MNFPITLHGTVEHGNKIGTSINIPTANIVPTEDITSLAFGVYYSSVRVEGREYRSITNIGRKPTIKDTADVNVESFIYDFEGDLYGKNIEVILYEFTRPEMKFDSLEALTEQINKDLEAGINYVR